VGERPLAANPDHHHLEYMMPLNLVITLDPMSADFLFPVDLEVDPPKALDPETHRVFSMIERHLAAAHGLRARQDSSFFSVGNPDPVTFGRKHPQQPGHLQHLVQHPQPDWQWVGYAQCVASVDGVTGIPCRVDFVCFM
jgi:hypothetical protein